MRSYEVIERGSSRQLLDFAQLSKREGEQRPVSRDRASVHGKVNLGLTKNHLSGIGLKSSFHLQPRNIEKHPSYGPTDAL